MKDEEHLTSFDLAARHTEATDSSATRTAAQEQRRGKAGGSHDTAAVKTTIRQMLEAMAAGEMDRMFDYLAEDFRSYSGASKEIFSKYLGDTTGTKVESEAMKIEWEGATATVTGVRWITGSLNFGLEMLVDEYDGEWRVTFMNFDSRDINR